jgi:putative nucleotidyltransferase with HDIG domain
MRLFKLILLLMLVAGIVPTVMVGWLSISDTRALLVRDVQDLSQERVKQLRLKTAAALDGPLGGLQALADTPGFLSQPARSQQAQLGALLGQHRALLVVTVFDAAGERVPGLQGFAVRDVRPTEVVAHEGRARALLADPAAPLRRGLRVGPVEPPAGARPATVTLVAPVGRPAEGFLAAELELGALGPLLAEERIGSSGLAYLVDASGRQVAAGAEVPGGGAGDLSGRPVVAHLLRAARESGAPALVGVGHFGEGEAAVVGAFALLPELGWAVVSEQPQATAYLPVATQQRRLLLGVLAAVAVAALLAALFSRTLTRPIGRFRDGALALARGEFGVQVDASARHELGDLARTFNYMSQQLSAYDQETRRLYESLEEGYLETIVALANSIDSKDSYTRGHSQRVADISVEIGQELGLPSRDLKLLRFGGILHDIGKIGIVDSILGKQTRLTDDEMAVMRGHPEIGDAIIGPISFLASVRAMVRNHHERWDGSGYPDRMRGEEIPFLARVVAAADTYDACTSTRPYQKAMPVETAVGILDRLSGAQLDPRVVDALKRVLDKKGLRGGPPAGEPAAPPAARAAS